MKRFAKMGVLAAIALTVGCGANYRDGVVYNSAAPESKPAASYGAGEIPAEQADGAMGGAPVRLVSRANLKIIYNAHIEVIVKDLSAARDRLKTAIQETGAFIASDDLREQSGQSRSGHWRIRVPTENFETLREAILEIGEPVQNKADSEDVTDQYFDLEGRIKNKKTEQEAIRRYLEDKKITAKLEEIVAVERELSRISGELEQLEGTMRRLQDRTALATIEVDFREIRDYVPPQTPTFGNRMTSAFSNSLADLKIAGENLAVGLAAVLPWLLVILIVLAPIVWIVRRIWRAILRTEAAAAVPLADTPRGS
jgi:hypothetical protein